MNFVEFVPDALQFGDILFMFIDGKSKPIAQNKITMKKKLASLALNEVDIHSFIADNVSSRLVLSGYLVL
jgi:hypothetical protein